MVANSSPAYKLYYFPSRNLGEVIRMLFHYADVPFEDVRILPHDWPRYKTQMPNGKMPVLEVDGRKISESYAITRFLARRFGLAGGTQWEQAKADEIADFHKDVTREFKPYVDTLAGLEKGNKDELHHNVFEPSVKKFFPIYENLLQEGKTGFLAGTLKPTFVDFLVSDWLHTIRGFVPDVIKSYPALGKFIDKVFSLPRLRKYIRDRPDSSI
ncbi:glutathione S-transferase 1 [Ditylenchus destructor]|nr:glutathione S-transferase 1 [Ditylenchus destructor]